MNPMLDVALDVAPGIDVETWRLTVPAKGACCVLEDEAGRPLLLATTANLRHALVTKLGPAMTPELPSKRIDYAAVVRRVRYRLVYSRFEANWAYLENARTLLPQEYRKLIRHWRAHWVAVDFTQAHPRFEAVEQPTGDPATCFGPLPDGRAARRVIDLATDLFDLCRYHNILVQAPHGTACAYKQMNRCDAPCDGSVTMDAYREQLRRASRFIAEPREQWGEELAQQMQAAAAELKFEQAARFKRQLEQVRGTTDPALARPLAPLTQFKFVTLQRGSRKGNVRVFLIAPGRIEFAGEIAVKMREAQIAELAARAATLADEPIAAIGRSEAERISLVGWQLFAPENRRGVFIGASDAADPNRIADGMDQLTAADEKADDAPDIQDLGEDQVAQPKTLEA